MRIYFVRHGKTEWNLARRLQGQKGDSPLLPESYEAIERVHKFLEPIDFDKVLSSPQKRALITADLLTNQSVSTDKRLSEWNFGDLEGWFISDAIAKSVSSVLNRFDSLAQDLLNSKMDNVLLVGHGASGTAGMRHLAGFPIAELRSVGGLANNTVTVLESNAGHFDLKIWDKQL